MHEKRCSFHRMLLPLSWESTQIRKCNVAGYTGRAITRVYVFLIDGIDIPFSWDILGISFSLKRALKIEIKYRKDKDF